jgi:hypothetical protein
MHHQPILRLGRGVEQALGRHVGGERRQAAGHEAERGDGSGNEL